MIYFWDMITSHGISKFHVLVSVNLRGGGMFTCIGSMKAWDLQQCRSFHYNHHPYTGTTEETEKGKISPKENCRVLEKRLFSLSFDLFSSFSSASQTVVEVMCSSHLYLEGSVAGEQPRLLTDLPFEVSANVNYTFHSAIFHFN